MLNEDGSAHEKNHMCKTHVKCSGRAILVNVTLHIVHQLSRSAGWFNIGTPEPLIYFKIDMSLDRQLATRFALQGTDEGNNSQVPVRIGKIQN